MIGGHGAAGSYGSTFESLGYSAAMGVGAAAATFGLISGVLVGGPLGRRLIVKYDLKPEEHQANYDDIKSVNAAGKEPLRSGHYQERGRHHRVHGRGHYGVRLGQQADRDVLPQLCGRHVRGCHRPQPQRHLPLLQVLLPLVDGIGDVMLNLYLALALMTLKLWELASLMGGVLLIVICQVVFIVTVSYFVIFRILGKSYDAAVMCSGLCGHGLGATPTAIVNMTAVTERYGMSSRAFMVVPIVGAFLVDIIYQPQTIAFIKFFVPAASNLVG